MPLPELPVWVSIVLVVLPLALIIVLVWRGSRRAKTVPRDACLREIEAAGGFDAWKQAHFGAPQDKDKAEKAKK